MVAKSYYTDNQSRHLRQLPEKMIVYAHKSSVNLGLPSENLGGLSMFTSSRDVFGQEPDVSQGSTASARFSDHLGQTSANTIRRKRSQEEEHKKAPQISTTNPSQPRSLHCILTFPPITVPHRTCVHLRPERSQTADIGQALPGPARRSEAKRGTRRKVPLGYFDNTFVQEGNFSAQVPRAVGRANKMRAGAVKVVCCVLITPHAVTTSIQCCGWLPRARWRRMQRRIWCGS